METYVTLTDQPLSVRDLESRVSGPAAGAIVSFRARCGTDGPAFKPRSAGKRVDHLVYEAYADMALAKLREISAEIRTRWPGSRVALAHRTGRLEVGEVSVAIAVASPHRAAAFEACRYAIESIKHDVPIWKREVVEGGAYWVEGPSGG